MKLGNRPLREDRVIEAALEAYGAVRHDGRLADRALEHVLRSKRDLYSIERRAVAEQVYGLLRSQRTVDFLLKKALPGFEQRASAAQDMMRLAAARVRNGESPSDVGGALHLGAVDRDALARLSKAEADIARLPPAEAFAVSTSLPDWFAGRLQAEFGDEARALAEAMNVRGPLVVRTNPLKAERGKLIDRLREAGIDARPTLRSPWGVVLETRENVFSIEAFKDGWMEVQDEGSQLLGALVDAPPTRVIDACAGAGGKTLQLAAQMRNRGELFALDIDERRLEDLRKRARRDGIHNVRVHVLPQDDAARDELLLKLENRTDRVLIDAPCSGSGTLRRKPDARYRLSEADIAMHVQRQQTLLARFAKYVKPGGRMVYGTCSVLRAENEDVVAAFLAEHPAFRLRSAADWLPPEAADVVHEGFLRAMPHKHDTDGFFGAVLERRPEEKNG